jgi:hypothetical protein
LGFFQRVIEYLPGDCFVVLVSLLFNSLRKALHAKRSIPFPYPRIVGLARCLLCVYTLFVVFVVHVSVCIFKKWDVGA